MDTTTERLTTAIMDRYTRAQVEQLRRCRNVTPNGVVFARVEEGGGIQFVLIREPHHSEGDIAKAAAYLRVGTPRFYSDPPKIRVTTIAD